MLKITLEVIKMKKFIVLLISLVMLSGQVFAAKSLKNDNDFYNGFYNAFLQSYFDALEKALLTQRYSKESVNIYLYSLSKRVSYKELEKYTMPCLSKLTKEEILYEGAVCFDSWSSDFMKNNEDLRSTLKK